ncbi:MAG: hypothetical protein WA851_02670 [Xanthobacteraceae bacterium]
MSKRGMLRCVIEHTAMMENNSSAARRKASQNSTTKQKEAVLGKIIGELGYDD